MARTKVRRTAAKRDVASAGRLAEATALHQKGATEAAERAYRDVLALAPNEADALHNLGVICAQAGRLEEAEGLIRRALAAKPDLAAAHNSLGIVLKRKGRAEDAVGYYRRALELDPSYVDAYGNLGLALRSLGRREEAIEAMSEVVRLKPNSPDAHFNLGLVLKDAGRLDAAIAALRAAIQLRADHAEGHVNLGIALRQSKRRDEALAAFDQALALKPALIEARLGRAHVLADLKRYQDAIEAYRGIIAVKPDHFEAHFALGGALLATGELDAATAAYRHGLELRPSHAEIMCNLANALKEQGKLDEALTWYGRAIEVRPDFHEALSNYGVALQLLGRLSESEAALDRAIALKPNFGAAYANLGVLRAEQERFDEAAACYRKAIVLQPDNIEAHQNLCAALIAAGDIGGALAAGRRAVEIAPEHLPSRFNLSHALLLNGAFEEGFEAYEARPSHKEATRRLKLAPLWSLGVRPGTSVLVYSDQGQGDAIQFARYVRLIEARGHKVVLDISGSLHRLLSGVGAASIIGPRDAKPPVDYQISLASLPHAFGTRLDSVPAEIPYVTAPADDVARFRARLEGAGRKIGLVWRGNPKHKNDRYRSIDPRLLEPLFAIAGTRFASLQKEARPGELDLLRAFGPIDDWSAELADFASTAALIEALDLVITVDTSVAHLAGALGKPVWIMLPVGPDWRWLLDREDSPWYPSARLFRQTTRGDWPGVIARVAAALREGEGAISLGVVRRPAPADQFETAVAHQEAGRIAAATALYEAILARTPDHVGALLNLGFIHFQRGDLASAETLIGRAAALDPNNADAHNGLGVIHEKRGSLEEAIAAFDRTVALRPQSTNLLLNLALANRKLKRHDTVVGICDRALALDPNDVKLLNTRGASYKDLGRHEDALADFGRSIELQPANPIAQLGRANTFYEMRRYDEAIDSYRRAIELKPDYREAHGNLGVALKELGRYDEAIASLERSLALMPDSPELLINYGNALRGAERVEEAVAQYQKALALRPDYSSAYNNLGITLAALDRRDEALAAYQRAIELRADYPEAYNNLGNLLKLLGRFDDADAAYARAIASRPSFVEAELNRANIDIELGNLERVVESYRAILAKAPALVDAHFNLSLVLLTLGAYAEGWKEHEWRWRRIGVKPHSFKQPLWHPEAPSGSAVLVHAEQGFGDTIQMLRYVPRLVARGHRVKLGAPKALRRLLAMQPDVEVVSVVAARSGIDFQVPFLSLPLVFGTTLDSIPAEVPYLHVPDEAMAKFRARLREGFKVGLVWRGNPKHKNDLSRSLDPALLKPLFDIPGVRFVSLQKEPRAGDVETLRGFGALDDLTDELGDFADTAALIGALDLVISVDTSVAHLAGALGKPLWVLVPFVPDWRWLLDREDSPWYPTARLFRQKQSGDWADVMARVVAAVRERARTFASAQAPSLVETAAQRRASFLARAEAAYLRGELVEAERLYREILASEPNHVDTLNNLGAICARTARSGEAKALLERVLARDPTHVDALNNLGGILAELGRLEEASGLIEHALAVRPGFAVGWSTLGVVLHRLGRLDQAIAALERATALDPGFADAWNNLGVFLQSLGRIDAAESAKRRVVTLRPASAEAHMSLASTLLACGRFAEGWREYEWRWKLDTLKPPPVVAPLWTLDAPPGAVLLSTEQGFGDSIQFARYAPLVAAKGHRVMLEATEPLARLLTGLPGTEVIARGQESIRVDRQISLLSLPGAFGTTLETIPAKVPYLSADAGAAARWRARLGRGDFAVGLAWRGNPAHFKDGTRSLDPALLKPLFGLDGVHLISLQKAPRAGDLKTLAAHGRFEDWTEELADFADTAALVEALDLVITVDTSVAHLAGALGKPVWIMLSEAPDWRWLSGRDDSPWYPTARLFRQTRFADWDGVIARVAVALRKMAERSPG